MKKQVIAVDIDDVLAANAEGWVKFSNKLWGTNLKVEDYDEDWSKMWQVDREEEAKRVKVFNESLIIKDYRHNEDAVEVLAKLSEKYELVIATSRTQGLHTETLKWLDKYYKDIFSAVHLSGVFEVMSADAHKATKADLVKRIGADYLIDDQAKHCLAVADAGIETILFGDYTWNSNIGPLPKGVTRCADWQAVEEYFDGRA